MMIPVGAVLVGTRRNPTDLGGLRDSGTSLVVIGWDLDGEIPRKSRSSFLSTSSLHARCTYRACPHRLHLHRLIVKPTGVSYVSEDRQGSTHLTGYQAFTFRSVEYAYRYSEGTGPPPYDVDHDHCGDVYLDLSTSQYWFRRTSTWEEASSEVQENGLPTQRHPHWKGEIRLYEGKWVNRTTLSESQCYFIVNALKYAHRRPFA